MNFEIIFYEENGKSQIAEFLNTLDNKDIIFFSVREKNNHNKRIH